MSGEKEEIERREEREVEVCLFALCHWVHVCTHAHFLCPSGCCGKAGGNFVQFFFFLQKPKTEKSKEPLCFSASRTSSQPRRHGTKEQPHRRKMSLAFDEFGRPFIIIKVRNPPLWAAPFTRSLCSQRIKKDFRSKNNLLRDLSPIVACTKR